MNIRQQLHLTYSGPSMRMETLGMGKRPKGNLTAWRRFEMGWDRRGPEILRKQVS